MKQAPRIGQSAEITHRVERDDCIGFADAVMPAVLSTPRLVDLLEKAARQALEPSLEAHERSVGTYLEIEHLAPTPVGHRIVCRAAVVLVQGGTVTFRISADDEREPLARGLHRRAIIDAGRFRARLDRKRGTDKAAGADSTSA